MRRNLIATVVRASIHTMVAFGLVACGGGGDTSGPNQNTGSISMGLLQSAVNGAPGTSVQITYIVTRSGGYSGALTINATGMPNGVTVSNTTQSSASNITSGVITFAVAANATAATGTITISASGSGVATSSATLAFTIVVNSGSSVALSVAPSAGSLAQGNSGQVIVTITRNSFPGVVTLSAEGLPGGVTPTFTPASTTGNTSTLVLTASASAVVGTAQVTIRGTGTGIADATTILTLQVNATAAPGFNLGAVPVALTIAQGASGQSTINVTRFGGFTGAVALTSEQVPAGLTVAPNPASIATGQTQSTVTFTASAGLATGTYIVNIRGTGTGVASTTTPVSVTITPPGGGSGSTTLNFSQCGFGIPLWLAYQDGDGAWVRVVPTNDIYTFTITQSRGGYAYVTRPNNLSSVRSITIFQGTKTEVSSNGAPITFCQPGTPPTKSITGNIANVSAAQLAYVGHGGQSTFAAVGAPFTLNFIPDGAHDLVAFRSAFTGASAADRGLIRQDQNFTTGTNVGTLDLGGAESFAAATATFTPLNLGAELLTANMSLLSGASCDASILATWGQPFTAPFLASGFPDNKMRAGDMHMMTATATGTNTNRFLTEVFHSISNRTVALGPNIAPITVVAAGGNYKRLVTAFGLPADYNAGVAMTYNQTSGVPHPVSITATAGWVALGGGTASLALPFFTGLPGWDDSYGPTNGANVNFTISAFGTNFVAGNTQCTAGLKNQTATFSGNM